MKGITATLLSARDQVSKRQKFEDSTGMSQDIFGIFFPDDFKNKMDEQSKQFSKYFRKGLDPDTIMSMAEFDTKMNEINGIQEDANKRWEKGTEKHNESLENSRVAREELYNKFADDYRSYISQILALNDKEFNNANKHASKMSSLAEQTAMAELEGKYAGRKMTPELESKKLQESLDIRTKFLEERYRLGQKELENERRGLGTFNYDKLNEDQKEWLRKKATLDGETSLSYKRLENEAKAHNLRFSKDATKADKFNNKLGSTVLKYMDAREKRTEKHHANIEKMERKHQREMQKFLDQDGNTLENKAKQYALGQHKFAQELLEANNKHSEAQKKARLTLEETLKSTHTGKGGLPVHLTNFLRDRTEEDVAEEIKRIPKTVEDYKKAMMKHDTDADVDAGRGWLMRKLFGDTEKGLESTWDIDTLRKKEKKLIDSLQKNMGTESFESTFGKLDELKGSPKKVEELGHALARLKHLDFDITKFASVFQSVDSATKFNQTLNKLEEDSKKSPLEKLKEEQIEVLSTFNEQMRGISGEKGSLVMFGRAVDSVTSKLNQLSNSFPTPKPDSDYVPQTTSVSVDLNVTATSDSETKIRYELTGVKSSGSENSFDNFVEETQISGGTRGVSHWNDSRSRSLRMGTRNRPSTANTKEILERNRRMGLA